ncbi:hypothetical protein INR49_000077 [Caranx melampygus]|nr:hypothetical protein INR49_000077 [Caranx melampygus]
MLSPSQSAPSDGRDRLLPRYDSDNWFQSSRVRTTRSTEQGGEGRGREDERTSSSQRSVTVDSLV